ncbi:hypothetical protein [Halobacterium noricense]|uniref:hypothetical protein n=1 Tax=Halobacterium noricense TaxID=223182 RepID=UPI001E5750CA|nr:hypothetical protein [Halobacterium noricense]UHH27301.1 hypothetical protein LT974_17545 [Halobacterium noricense]
MSPAEKQQWASDNSKSTSAASSGQEARVDVVVQEVAARIDSGRALEDALRGELENMTPELKQKVVDELRDELPNRL